MTAREDEAYLDLVIREPHSKSWNREIGLVIRLKLALVVGHDFLDRSKYKSDLKSLISDCTPDLSGERSFSVTEAVCALNYESTSSLAAGYGHKKSRR